MCHIPGRAEIPGGKGLIKGISQMATFSDQMEGFQTSSEKSQQDMEDAEFHEESENAHYL